MRAAQIGSKPNSKTCLERDGWQAVCKASRNQSYPPKHSIIIEVVLRDLKDDFQSTPCKGSIIKTKQIDIDEKKIAKKSFPTREQ